MKIDDVQPGDIVSFTLSSLDEIRTGICVEADNRGNFKTLAVKVSKEQNRSICKNLSTSFFDSGIWIISPSSFVSATQQDVDAKEEL